MIRARIIAFIVDSILRNTVESRSNDSQINDTCHFKGNDNLRLTDFFFYKEKFQFNDTLE